MTFTKALLGLAAAVAVSTAQAAIPAAYAPGSMIDLSSGSANIGAAVFGPSLASYSFNLTGTSDLGLSFFSVLGNLNLDSISLSGPTSAGVTPTGGTASFTGLSAGSYALTFNFGSGSSGFFAGSLNVTPVPEAETLALALAGLGVVATVRRRRAANA